MCQRALIAVVCSVIVLAIALRKQKRSAVLPSRNERVIILGASTTDGIGASIAAESLKRGVRSIILVGRSADGLRNVHKQLIATFPAECRATTVIQFPADCTRDADVLAVRDRAVSEFGGVDTLYVVFGSIVTKTLLGVAGADPVQGDDTPTNLSPAELSHVHSAMEEACTINVTGTALVLVAFIPVLQTSSRAPHVGVIGSLAALIPAPTRALYCAVKAAQQQLVLGAAAECETQAQIPGRSLVKFTVLAPGTVATSFRSRDPHARALSPTVVAHHAIDCINKGSTGVVPLPSKYFIAWLLSILLPKLVERGAHAKYGY